MIQNHKILLLPMLPILIGTEPQASKPLLDDAAISDTIDLAAIASTVVGVTGAKADEEKTTPKCLWLLIAHLQKTESLQSLFHHRIRVPLMVTFQFTVVKVLLSVPSSSCFRLLSVVAMLFIKEHIANRRKQKHSFFSSDIIIKQGYVSC